LDKEKVVLGDNGGTFGTPLHMAARQGHVEAMRYLIDRGADINAPDKDNDPILSAAICSGSLEAVQILLDKDVKLCAPCSIEPLAVAAANCDLKSFDEILKAGGDKWNENAYHEALCAAAEEGRMEILDRLLGLGREYSDDVFQTAFELAGEEHNWEIVQRFLDCGRKFKCDDMFKRIVAGSEEQDSMLDKLWEHTNGRISQATRDQSLYEATDNEKQSTVVLLLTKFGANPNATGTELEEKSTSE
jgi:ankyrin repeat protein